LGVDGVHRGIVVEIGKIDGGAHDTGQGAACRTQGFVQVGKHLAGNLADVLALEHSLSREWNLPRAEDELTDNHGVAQGCDTGRVDLLKSHRTSLHRRAWDGARTSEGLPVTIGSARRRPVPELWVVPHRP